MKIVRECYCSRWSEVATIVSFFFSKATLNPLTSLHSMGKGKKMRKEEVKAEVKETAKLSFA